jgi:hypothetical protein
VFNSADGLRVLVTAAGQDQVFVFGQPASVGTVPEFTPSQDTNLTLIVTLLFSGEGNTTAAANGTGEAGKFAFQQGAFSFLQSVANLLVGGPDDVYTTEVASATLYDGDIDIKRKLRTIDLCPEPSVVGPEIRSSRRQTAPSDSLRESVLDLADRQTVLDEFFSAWPTAASAVPSACAVESAIAPSAQRVVWDEAGLDLAPRLGSSALESSVARSPSVFDGDDHDAEVWRLPPRGDSETERVLAAVVVAVLFRCPRLIAQQNTFRAGHPAKSRLRWSPSALV